MTSAISRGATPFVCYGTSVRRGTSGVTVFAIFHRRDVTRARKALIKARTALGAPHTVRFDSRALQPGTDPLAPSGTEEARQRLAHMIETFNAVPGMLRYAYIDLSGYPLVLDDSTEGRKAWGEVGQVLRNACFAVPAGGELGPQEHECEVLMAEEGDRNAYAHGVLFDLADMIGHACATSLIDGETGWAQTALDGVRYWSKQEVRHRFEERSGLAETQNP